MRWWIEIIDIVGDERFLADLLTGLNITLDLQENRTYFTSDQFELLSTNTEVWEVAKRIRDIVSEVSNGFPDARMSFQLGDYYEQREDGSRCTYEVAYSGSVSPGRGCVDAGTTTDTPIYEITEEERARLEAERLERERQEKLALVLPRLVSAFLDERARKVQRFLQQDLTPARMYHIYELIKDDLGKKKLDNLASKKDWERFSHSVNHQEVFGDDSRHIASKEKPPANPMYLSEAQAFISKVADSWFRRKCVDDSIAQQPR